MYWYSIYGTGATIHSIERMPDGRVQFTVWLSVLWVPIVPISSWTGEYAGERPGDPSRDEAPCFTDLVRRPHEPLRLARTLLWAWLLVGLAVAPAAVLIWSTQGRAASNLEMVAVFGAAVWPVALLILTERSRRRRLRGPERPAGEMELVVTDAATGEKLPSAVLAAPNRPRVLQIQAAPAKTLTAEPIEAGPDAVTAWWWQRRVRKAEAGMNTELVVGRLGQPSRTLHSGDVDIWYYDLKIIGSTRYMHCVAFSAGRVCQSYIGMEPLEGGDLASQAARQARERRILRVVAAIFAVGVGLLFVFVWRDWDVNGLPAPWLGYLLLAIGIMALLGVNVFRGGPLDRRMDRQ